MLGKIIKNGKRYEFCELDEVETHQTVTSIIEENISLFSHIYTNLKAALLNKGIPVTKRQLVDIAIVIFQQSGIKSYPVLKTALYRKVNNKKEFSKAEQESQEESAYEQQTPQPDSEAEGDYVLEHG